MSAKVPFCTSDTRDALLSSVQNAHSAAGTATSAFGNTGSFSRVVSPVMWSAWKCVTATSPTEAGSMPAACKLRSNRPEVGPSWPAPVPASNATTPRPVSTKVTVKGLGRLAVGSAPSRSAAST